VTRPWDAARIAEVRERLHGDRSDDAIGCLRRLALDDLPEALDEIERLRDETEPLREMVRLACDEDGLLSKLTKERDTAVAEADRLRQLNSDHAETALAAIREADRLRATCAAPPPGEIIDTRYKIQQRDKLDPTTWCDLHLRQTLPKTLSGIRMLLDDLALSRKEPRDAFRVIRVTTQVGNTEVIP
jgi:hypothetical protein